MSSLDRFDRTIAESAQASAILSNDQASILNYLDRAVSEIERARAFLSDTTDDKVMAQWIESIRGYQRDIKEGY